MIKKWIRFDGKIFTDRLEVASKITALLTFSAGVMFYVLERTLPVELSVASPSVIEFRCQVLTINFEDCFRDKEAELRNLSMTAALMVSAQGPAVQSISIEKVEATISLPWNKHSKKNVPNSEAQVINLTAFWSGNLTGSSGNFQQVVAESLKGGESVRREYWLMPMPGLECSVSDGALSQECALERRDFLPWYKFVESAYTASKNASDGKPPKIDIKIKVFGTQSSWWSTQVVNLNCSVYLGRSAYLALRDPVSYDLGEPGWLTLPCR